MGELFLGEMIRTGAPPERVVIKRLLADLQDEDKYVKMFHAEAAVMARLQHPNIVKLFNTPVIEHSQCLAMEFVYGPNLQQIIHRHELIERRVPVRLALTIIAMVLRGLHYAHTFKEPDGRPLQLVHRDVSPGNVLVGYNGAVKLTDFGIAKSQMSLVSTTVGIVKGKARYLAPEQILGEPATARSDVFSAAVVTVELLTRTPLFERASLPKTLYAIVNGERPDLEKHLPEPRPALVEALDRALAPDPRHRPATAETFARQLLIAARDYGGPATGPEIGSYVQGVFHDREPLPPLGTGTDVPTVLGQRPVTSAEDVQVRVQTPYDDASTTHTRPTHDTNPVWPSNLDEPDAGPTYVLPSDDTRLGEGGPAPTLDEPPPARPTFDEAVSALALVQRSRDEAIPATPEAAVPPDAVRLPPRAVAAVTFAIGIGVGIGATLLTQSIVGGPAPAPIPIVTVAEVPAYLDVLYPVGAEIHLDGKKLENRAPVHQIELSEGRHSLRVLKGNYRRNWSFEAGPGDVIEARQQLHFSSIGGETGR